MLNESYAFSVCIYIYIDALAGSQKFFISIPIGHELSKHNFRIFAVMDVRIQIRDRDLLSGLPL